jgi:hypothetical protein
MPSRVVPSAAVSLIDIAFPFASDTDARPPTLDASHAGQLAGLVDVISAVPVELLVLSSEHLAAFTGALGTLRMALRMFEARVTDWKVKGHNIRVLRSLLTQCPDDVPAATVVQLQFISDGELQHELRHDISRASNALTAGDWKSATVLGGAVVEALLRWALDQQPQAAASAAAALAANNTFPQKPPTDLNDWTLHHYAEVAGHLKMVSKETLAQVRLAKSFRNLIHPGRAVRLSRKCDRGTALAALAAVEMVVGDLE